MQGMIELRTGRMPVSTGDFSSRLILWHQLLLLSFSLFFSACSGPAKKHRCRSRKQSGNILLALFSAVMIVGGLGASLNMFVRGPLQSSTNVTRYNVAKTDMIAAVALLSEGTLMAEMPDCDADGMIESLEHAAASNPAMAPVGGGNIPAHIGAAKFDPWRSAYGYCVWDLGAKVHDAACGTSRLRGVEDPAVPSIAVISAGPDKIFQTSCHDWADDADALVQRVSGSDDIVHIFSYAQFLSPVSGKSKLGEMPDEACTDATVGIMRIVMGNTAQMCTTDGWVEIGSSTQSDTNFVDVLNSPLSQSHTSNTISFSGFFGSKPLTVTGTPLPTLLLNNEAVTPPVHVKAGDIIALQASASGNPEQTLEFSITLNAVRKVWRIVTRDKYPPSLTITPASTAFHVTGPGSPAYSPTTGFVVRNTGERSTGTLHGTILSPATHYQIDASGLGDGCEGTELGHNQQCALDVQARSSGEAIPNGTLTVTDGTFQVSSNLSGTRSGWTCNLPWGGTLNDGGSITGYAVAGTCGGSCSSGPRTCTNAVLGGNASFDKGSCDNVSMCSYSWYQSGWGGCTSSCGTGTRSQTVYCRRSDGVQVSDSFCSGAKPATSQSCSNYTYNYTGYTYGSCSATCGGGTRSGTRSCQRCDGQSASCSMCGGSCTTSGSCNTQSCGVSCGTMTLGHYTHEYYNLSEGSYQSSVASCKTWCQLGSSTSCCTYSPSGYQGNTCHRWPSSCRSKWNTGGASLGYYGAYCN